jgi:hypothetical protein
MTDSIAVEVANVTVDTLKQKCLISRIFNQPKAKLAIGGNTFIIGLNCRY